VKSACQKSNARSVAAARASVIREPVAGRWSFPQRFILHHIVTPWQPLPALWLSRSSRAPWSPLLASLSSYILLPTARSSLRRSGVVGRGGEHLCSGISLASFVGPPFRRVLLRRRPPPRPLAPFVPLLRAAPPSSCSFLTSSTPFRSPPLRPKGGFKALPPKEIP
jgi:hypothetical protein